MSKTMTTKIVMRNDTSENWQKIANSVVLLRGEIGLEIAADGIKMKIGDGTNVWATLPYFVSESGGTPEVVQPENYTWADLLGIAAAGETTTTTNLGLTKPALSDLVDVRILNANADLIDSSVHALNDQITSINNRLEHLISSSTSDTEVIDARVAANGTTYPDLGSHVRALGEEITYVRDNTADLIGGSLVDGLSYNDSLLQLTACGSPVGEPVKIVGGGAASGGTFDISLTNLLDSRIISVPQGEPVELVFRYVSADNENITDGPGIGTLIVNNVRKATFTVPQGDNTYNITDYLATGANTVKLTVENSEGNSKTLVYTITVIALAITTTAAAMDLYSGNVSFPYVLTGQGEKTVHFIMDNYELATEVVTATDSSRTFNLPPQSDGAHIFKIFAEVENEGQIIRSNILQIGMMYYSAEMTTQAVLVNFVNDKTYQQGETLTIPYLCFDPFSQNTEVTLSIIDENNTVYSTKTLTVDQTPKTWVTQDYPAGLTTFRLTCGSAQQNITIPIALSDFKRTIITDSLALEFSAAGRNNGEENPEENNLNATFEGFGWAGADGWVEDDAGQTVLRFLPGNKMTIPFKPFATDFRNSGYTIEAEFATHNVRDYDSVVATCYNGGRGFVIKSQQAQLSSEQSSVAVQFREDSKVRVAFVVEQKNLNKFVYVYINGVMCGVTQYAESDNFAQPTPVEITIGAESCGLDLYVLRIYNKGFTRFEELNNFICDRTTLAERKALDEANDVLDDNGAVTISSLPMGIPYMILECEELPQFKGDKKKNKSITFVDPMNPQRSFTASGVQLNVQGTSSAGYPVKNYKVDMKNGLTYTNSGEYADGFPIFEDGLEGRTICLKADFASSEKANNVMLVDYYEQNCPFKTEPQKLDDRVRQGVRGFACCVFWHNTTTGEVSFLGCYNANDDKSNENVFGFDREIYPHCECVEILNNTSNRVIFRESDFASTITDTEGNTYPAWQDDFEFRFPDLDEPYSDTTQFQRLCDWLVSCNRDLVSSKEEKVARLEKFKNEFDQYLYKDACVFYYLFTEIFLMVDNRAKNMFLTTFDGQHWFPIPYDFDTSLAINNEGVLAFDYNLEDTDTIDGTNVYNGQYSALWCNVRDAFKNEIMEMYQNLRNAGTLSYSTLATKMANHQAIWPQAIWNEDSYNKYLLSYLLKGENYLDMLLGDKKAQRDFWLYNGFKYRDSKYQAGEANTNFITLRCYDTGDIQITPYSHIYPRVKFGSATVTNRGYRNKTYTMKCPIDTMNDTEVYIYSSDRIKSVGDLSHLKVGLAIFSMATKLQEIILGSATPGYENPNLYSLDVGNNQLLTLINVQNCTNEKFTSLDTSNCHGLETILAKGTKLTGINLPNGGHLRHLELPATLTNFTIKNQNNIEQVTFEGYNNLTTLTIENTRGLDIEAIINGAPVLDRVRLVNVDWEAASEESLAATIAKLKTCIGLDAIGNNTAAAIVNGTVRVGDVSDTLLQEINNVFPELIVITNNVAKFFIRYLNYDNTLLYRYIANEGENAIDPIAAGLIEAPTRENTETAKYSFIGWQELPQNISKPHNIVAQYDGQFRVDFCSLDGTIQNSQWINKGQDAREPVSGGLMTAPTKPSTAQYDYKFSGWDREFTNIQEPITLLPQFESILRSYRVYFKNDDVVLQESVVLYGSQATFTGDTAAIKKIIGGEESIYYEFIGWSPSPDEPITGNTNFQAQFVFDGYIQDDWTTIIAAARTGNVDKYGIGGRKVLSYSVDGKHTSTVELEIAGKNHDKLAAIDPEYNNGSETAALTFICKVLGDEARIMNGVQHSIGSNSSLNTGGWSVSELRSWLQTTLFAALPTELQQGIKPVVKQSDLGFFAAAIKETNDTIWIPSDRELNCESTGQVLIGQGEPYPVYTNASSRIKANEAGGIKIYWTRSTGREGQHYFRYIDSNGYPNNMGAASQSNGIAWGFSV